MVKKKTRPQLRTCSVCGKLGHNKSTCPVHARKTRAEKHPQKGTVKFFVHHVNSASDHSPHLVNLKDGKTDIFDKVHAIAPEENYDSLYHFYHQKPAAAVTPTKTGLFATPLNQTPADIMASARELDETNFNNDDRTEEIVNRDEGQKSLRRAYCASAPAKRRRAFRFPSLPRLPLTLGRVTFAGLIIAMVLILPFQANSYYKDIKQIAGQVTADGTAGFMALQEAATAILRADLTAARTSSEAALDKFQKASAAMQSEHRFLQTLAGAVPVLAGAVQSRQRLLLAGEELSLGNAHLLRGVEEAQTAASTTLLARVLILKNYLDSALPNYRQALANLSAVDPEILPFEYRATYKDFKYIFEALVSDLENLARLGGALNEIFGTDGLRRYLVIFQNPHEIRPTGGFMGSFALIDFKDGAIARMVVPPGGSYDLKGQLSELVEPPAPLLLLKPRWEFQDANWFPDFPASAEKAMWFYRKSRGMTADGVIAVNATVLERLLAIIGPITDEKRDLVLAADDAINTIQKVVEEGPEKKINKPKQIISDLAPKFIAALASARPEHILPLLVNLSDALKQKEIQAYFTDAAAEATIADFGWGGKILPTGAGQDYLMVVNTNIQGQKSDAKILQTISHQAVIGEDGTVTVTVNIAREHTGISGEKMYGAPNINYLRVYAPLGAKLVAASGFTWPDEKNFVAPARGAKKDIQLAAAETEVGIDSKTGTRVTDEFGKTAFGNWLVTLPGQKSEAVFVYELPFRVINDGKTTARYQLVAQKQSGCESDFDSQIIFPSEWHPTWNEGRDLQPAANGIQITAHDFDRDSVWSVILTKE